MALTDSDKKEVEKIVKKEIKDEDMLENIDDFNKLYEECVNTI